MRVDHALDKVKALTGYTFDWKDGERKKRDGRQVGLIAQDVEKVVPEAIIRNRTDGMLGLNYDSLVGVLVEAVKELDGRLVAEAEARAALERRLDAIEQQLRAAKPQ